MQDSQQNQNEEYETKTECDVPPVSTDAEADHTDTEKNERSSQKKNKKLSKGMLDLFEWIELVLVSFCAVVLIFTFVARPAIVVGDSMVSTLIDKEALIISPISHEYKYKDIVVFQIPQNIGKDHGDAIVKRVIATEGQWVDIDLTTWEVFVANSKEELENAAPLDEPYVNYVEHRTLSASVSFPLCVPEGCLFVMGDNRSESYDSRAFGCIREEYILGKVLIRISPFSKFGVIG